MRSGLLVLSWMLLAVGCGPSGDQQAGEDRYRALMNEGVGQMGRFDFEAAGAAFEAALEVRPDSEFAALDRANSVLNRTKSGSQTRALELLRDILA